MRQTKDQSELSHIDNAVSLKNYLIGRLAPLGYNITMEIDPDEDRVTHRFRMWYGREDKFKGNCITYVQLTPNIKTWFQEWIDQAKREYTNRNLINNL